MNKIAVGLFFWSQMTFAAPPKIINVEIGPNNQLGIRDCLARLLEEQFQTLGVTLDEIYIYPYPQLYPGDRKNLHYITRIHSSSHPDLNFDNYRLLFKASPSRNWKAWSVSIQGQSVQGVGVEEMTAVAPLTRASTEVLSVNASTCWVPQE